MGGMRGGERGNEEQRVAERCRERDGGGVNDRAMHNESRRYQHFTNVLEIS